MMTLSRIRMALAVIGLSFGLAAPSVSGVLLLTASNSQSEIVDGNADPFAQADETAGLVARPATINYGGLGLVEKVVVRLQFMKCAEGSADIATPSNCKGPGFPGEIIFRLASPADTVVSLIEPNTYLFDEEFGLVTVIFDGDIVGDPTATPPKPPPTVGPHLVTDKFFPGIEQLTAFNGQSPDGDWTLYFGDTTAGDPLAFLRFGLLVTVQEPSAAGVPEPATLALLGLGLASLVALRRRRK